MTDTNLRDKLLQFLDTIRPHDVTLEQISNSTHMFDEGLMDSLMVLEIITYLEVEHNFDFAASGVDPVMLGSVDGILGMISGAEAS